MNKRQRIKKNDEFQYVFKNGKSFANRQFVVYVLKRRECYPFRIGLSVSKKIGNAVTRNRVKRLIRATVQQLIDDIPNGYDMIIIARNPTANMNFHAVKSSLTHVLRRAKVL